MMTFHKFLVIASAIQCYVHKILTTVRGAENPGFSAPLTVVRIRVPTGPKLPDFTLLFKMDLDLQCKFTKLQRETVTKVRQLEGC